MKDSMDTIDQDQCKYFRALALEQKRHAEPHNLRDVWKALSSVAQAPISAEGLFNTADYVCYEFPTVSKARWRSPITGKHFVGEKWVWMGTNYYVWLTATREILGMFLENGIA